MKKQQKQSKQPKYQNQGTQFTPLQSEIMLQNFDNQNKSMTNSNILSSRHQNTFNKTQQRTYTQYLQNFHQNNNAHIDYKKSPSSEIQKSLNDMRILLKEFNTIINKMMDKNYQLLAEFTPSALIQPPDIEKQIEVLSAEIQNSKKLISNQEHEMDNLLNIADNIKDKQEFEQRLIDEIAEIKNIMPNISLESKHNASDINKNGYTLVNQEEDGSLYLRVNILKNDYERHHERFRKAEAKDKELEEKLREFQEKDYDASIKLQECIGKAKEMDLQITSKGVLISLKAKYDDLKKRKDQERKKIALAQHVTKANQQGIMKSMADMKKLFTEYETRLEMVSKKIAQVELQSEKVMNGSNLLGELAKKSLSYKFAQTLLKGDKTSRKIEGVNKNGKNLSLNHNNKGQQQILDLQNPKNVKVAPKKPKAYFPVRNTDNSKSFDFQDDIKNKRNFSKPEIDIKERNKDFSFEDEEGGEYSKQKSQLFNIRKPRPNSRSKFSNQSPSIKHWKDQSLGNKKKSSDHKDEVTQKNEYQASKPAFTLKKKINKLENQSPATNNNKEQDLPIAPKFSRLSKGKKKPNDQGNQLSDEYMKYLQEKGRSILKMGGVQ